MKPVRTIQSVLLCHVFIATFCLISTYSLIGLISIVISVVGLVLTVWFPDQILFVFLLILGLVLGIVYYVSEPLFIARVINEASIAPAAFFVSSVVHSVTLRFAKYKSLYGVKSIDTFEDPEVWKKTHEFACLCFSFVTLPLFLLILYLGSWAKVLLGALLVIIAALVPIAYAHFLAKKRSNKPMGYRD